MSPNIPSWSQVSSRYMGRSLQLSVKKDLRVSFSSTIYALCCAKSGTQKYLLSVRRITLYSSIPGLGHSRGHVSRSLCLTEKRPPLKNTTPSIQVNHTIVMPSEKVVPVRLLFIFHWHPAAAFLLTELFPSVFVQPHGHSVRRLEEGVLQVSYFARVFLAWHVVGH